jgi:hypothetical protein
MRSGMNIAVRDVLTGRIWTGGAIHADLVVRAERDLGIVGRPRLLGEAFFGIAGEEQVMERRLLRKRWPIYRWIGK